MERGVKMIKYKVVYKEDFKDKAVHEYKTKKGAVDRLSKYLNTCYMAVSNGVASRENIEATIEKSATTGKGVWYDLGGHNGISRDVTLKVEINEPGVSWRVTDEMYKFQARHGRFPSEKELVKKLGSLYMAGTQEIIRDTYYGIKEAEGE